MLTGFFFTILSVIEPTVLDLKGLSTSTNFKDNQGVLTLEL